MKALIALAVIALAFIGIFIAHLGHNSAFIVIHKGQPMPKKYIEAWAFGNTTVVEVEPSSTTVTVAPWS